jgi:hypothetical protein
LASAESQDSTLSVGFSRQFAINDCAGRIVLPTPSSDWIDSWWTHPDAATILHNLGGLEHARPRFHDDTPTRVRCLANYHALGMAG